MRVTEHRLLAIAKQSNEEARSRAAAAGEELASGVRVKKASDDPLAWADGKRATVKMAQAEARGSSVRRAIDRLEATDRALEEISEHVRSARELSIQMSNGTFSAQERALAAERVQGLIDSVLAAANARGIDGDHLFAGSRVDAPAFDATGTYLGDGSPLQVATGNTSSGAAGVVGSDFDPIGALVRLRDALAANSIADVQASVGELDAASSRLADVRSTVGYRMQHLEEAEEAAGALELRLGELRAAALGADPFDAATRLAEARSLLETSRALAEEISAMMRR